MKRALLVALTVWGLSGCPGNYIEGSGRDFDDAGEVFVPRDAGRRVDAGRSDAGSADGG